MQVEEVVKNLSVRVSNKSESISKYGITLGIPYIKKIKSLREELILD
jgi:hypothetical protein